MAEPRLGDYCFYLLELYEVKSIVQVYRTVVVRSNKRSVTLDDTFTTQYCGQIPNQCDGTE